MKSKKVKKILLIALTCVAISASVSAEAAMKSQITIESKNKYEQLKISESRVYGEYPTGDYKKIMLLPSVSKVEKFCFEDNLNINDLLGMVPLSRRLLEIKFKKEVGVSVYQYVLQYRVEQLADLLLKTDKPLMELADMCGFDGSKNVARVFYKYKKMTPLKWRNLYKSK